MEAVYGKHPSEARKSPCFGGGEREREGDAVRRGAGGRGGSRQTSVTHNRVKNKAEAQTYCSSHQRVGRQQAHSEGGRRVEGEEGGLAP